MPTGEGAVTVVLADDHEIVRRGLSAIVEAESGFTVVGEANEGWEAVRLTASLRPDVLVLDLVMPGLGGVEVIKQVRRQSPLTRVVVLSVNEEEATVLEALRAGATAYVLKGNATSELIQAIVLSSTGRRYVSSSLSDRVLDAYIEGTGVATPPAHSLTTRELEVLHLTVEGQTGKQIAAQLGISPRTAETHRQRLMRKLGVHGRTELIHWAVRQGYVPPSTG
jgi:two-component system, NarL family, response regulator NreC